MPAATPPGPLYYNIYKGGCFCGRSLIIYGYPCLGIHMPNLGVSCLSMKLSGPSRVCHLKDCPLRKYRSGREGKNDFIVRSVTSPNCTKSGHLGLPVFSNLQVQKKFIIRQIVQLHGLNYVFIMYNQFTGGKRGKMLKKELGAHYGRGQFSTPNQEILPGNL